MSARDETVSGPFYHGTKADLRPGDLITPGHRSNYNHGKRTNPWVYMSAVFSAWAAELALGDGPGRIYIVEPTGPFEDDPDLTDKKFAGNPTQSYRSRFPLRVVGEVTGWQGHTAEEIQTMRNAVERHHLRQAARIARIPSASDVDHLHAQADASAREWAADAEYRGCALLMRIRGEDVITFFAMQYFSEARGEARSVELPPPIGLRPALELHDGTLSGRITHVSYWRDAWAAVIESCVTEIGLSFETRMRIAVDAMNDSLAFRIDADGPERSWQRNLRLARGVLSDLEHGQIWDFAGESFDGARRAM